MKDVVVVGAGITGLTLAYYLKEAGLDVSVVESSGRVGGVIDSEMQNGFLLEYGPNTTLSKPAISKLIEDLALSEALQIARKESKKRYLAILDSNHSPYLCPAPGGLLSAALTPILSFRGKLRVMLEPFSRASCTEDMDVRTFMAQRIGSEAVEQVVEPFLSGVWAADIDRLSARSALPLIWDMVSKHGSIVKGLFKLRSKRKKIGQKRKRPTLIGFSEGLSFLTDVLAERIGRERIFLNSEAQELSLAEGVVSLSAAAVEQRIAAPRHNSLFQQRLLTRKLVLTTQAPSAARIIEQLDPELAEELRAIPYSPLGVLHLAYPAGSISHPLDGYGFLVTPKLRFGLLGALFSSSLFFDRAPKGFHLLTCFAGGGAKPEFADVTDEATQVQIISELNSLIGSRTSPEILSAQFIPQAIPSYPVGHYRTEEKLKAFEQRFPQIKMLGNWRSGISVSDRIQCVFDTLPEIVP